MPLLGGIRPPIAALLCALLAVAALSAVGLGTVRDQDVPQAVSDAERQIAADTATSVATSVNARATALRRAAASAAPAAGTTPAQVMKSLLSPRTSAGRSVQGSVLLAPHTGKPLAANGERVPLTGLDVPALARPNAGDLAPRLVTSGRAGPRLLFFARVAMPAPGRNKDENADQARDLDGGSGERELVLVVSEKLLAPQVHGDGRTGQLVDRNGKVLAGAAVGDQALTPGSGDHTLLAAVQRVANAGPPRTADTSGSLLGDRHDGLRRVAGWAAVADGEGKDVVSGLGLTTLTFRDVPPAKGGPDYTRFAVLAAGSLVVIAALVTVVLWVTVQRPLLRLHLSAARLAKGTSECPGAREELARPVPVHAFGELGRAGRALESVRRQLLGETGPEPAPPVGRRPGVRSVLLVCALLIATWGVPQLFLVHRVQAGKAVPAAAVADQQARTEAAADRVRQILGQSYTDLTAVASSLSGQPRERTADALRRALAGHSKYRSLYVLDRSGAILTRVGEEPLRTLVHAPTGSGITRVNTSGTIPSIAAYAQIPPAKNAKDPKNGVPAVLFAEIDVNALNSLLSRPGLGSVWLTDEQHRVLAASVGFEAFQPLPSQGFTRLVARTGGAPGSAGSPVSAVLHAETTPGAGPSVAAAAPLAQTGPAAGLGWRVVSAEPAAALKLTAYQVQARTMLAGLLALAAGIACLGWLHIVVVRPLRALAGYAERLAGGDRRTVLYPVHHDECGSVARSLELLRQALADRARGGGTDPAAAAAPAPSSRSASVPGS